MVLGRGVSRRLRAVVIRVVVLSVAVASGARAFEAVAAERD